MGLIAKVDEPSPVFVHVDVDDYWAICECYGLEVAREWAHYVSSDALPRFRQLFSEMNIQATFFVVGRDVETEPFVELAKQLMEDGHRIANHSYSHPLSFRAMDRETMLGEVRKCNEVIKNALGLEAVGFRAPGYGWSRELLGVLDELGYRYDSSLMPSPYGGVFRWMDGRLRRKTGPGQGIIKTQYPKMGDTWNSLFPAPISGTGIVELPVATSGLLRLPFQAGVCMRMGWPYFRSCFESFRLNPALPFVFLFHAADLADFSRAPDDFFRSSSFFNRAVDERVAMARRFLKAIVEDRPVVTTEDWLGR